MLEYRLVVERLAYKQGDLDGQSMVDCAREMLELTVLLWVQRDRFVEHHHDYDWMLMCVRAIDSLSSRSQFSNIVSSHVLYSSRAYFEQLNSLHFLLKLSMLGNC